MKLKDKVIAVTGASSGIGRAIAETGAREGAKVVVADLNEAGGQETVDQITAAGGQAAFIRIDVSKEEDAQRLVDFAVETFGRLDGAANNAGVALAQQEFAETETALWQKTMDINATGMFYMLRAQLKYMKENGGGAIVNTASMAAIKAVKGVTAYAASKWAVVGLTKQAAIEGVDHGIRVNAIAPGVIKTAIFDETPAKTMAQFEAMQPGGRLGDPSEMGEMVAFLLSDEASYVNAVVLSGDMGASAF
ncbi:MAG TPA: SDR family oxidoreductase [Actinomycetales bacterium]|nr:SDR family oxidoreductase [Actinomycetales bacterium]